MKIDNEVSIKGYARGNYISSVPPEGMYFASQIKEESLVDSFLTELEGLFKKYNISSIENLDSVVYPFFIGYKTLDGEDEKRFGIDGARVK